MEVCIAYVHDEPIMLRLDDGVVYINEEAQPIKGLTKEMLTDFSATVAAIPYTGDSVGYKALVNSKRTVFLLTLIGLSVGDDCISYLTHILDHVHYDVLEYLGEIDNA